MTAPIPSQNNILVFGASGGTGRHVVQRALAAGYQVTAFVRDPGRFELEHPRLRTVRGDVLEAARVAEVMPGHDAVVVALGAPALSRLRIRERGTQNVIDAMNAAGVRRLVVQSSYGIAETRGELPPFVRWVVVPFYLARAFRDHEAQERLVRQSDLAWTIVRPPFLTDDEHRSEVVVGALLDAKATEFKISRASVADFMVTQLRSSQHLSASPAISF